MQEELSVAQLKQKLAQAQDDVVAILHQLQSETGITINGITLYSNQIEVARDADILLKIEYDL